MATIKREATVTPILLEPSLPAKVAASIARKETPIIEAQIDEYIELGPED